jgi:hypothetical protein
VGEAIVAEGHRVSQAPRGSASPGANAALVNTLSFARGAFALAHAAVGGGDDAVVCGRQWPRRSGWSPSATLIVLLEGLWSRSRPRDRAVRVFALISRGEGRVFRPLLPLAESWRDEDAMTKSV